MEAERKTGTFRPHDFLRFAWLLYGLAAPIAYLVYASAQRMIAEFHWNFLVLTLACGFLALLILYLAELLRMEAYALRTSELLEKRATPVRVRDYTLPVQATAAGSPPVGIGAVGEPAHGSLN